MTAFFGLRNVYAVLKLAAARSTISCASRRRTTPLKTPRLRSFSPYWWENVRRRHPQERWLVRRRLTVRRIYDGGASSRSPGHSRPIWRCRTSAALRPLLATMMLLSASSARPTFLGAGTRLGGRLRKCSSRGGERIVCPRARGTKELRQHQIPTVSQALTQCADKVKRPLLSIAVALLWFQNSIECGAVST